MYFFIFILCLNTITSMINTNVFFDFTDFQVRKCESNTHRRGKRGGASGKWSNGWENVRGTWCLRGVYVVFGRETDWLCVGILGGIPCGILCGIFCGILWGILWGILCGILWGILWGIFCGTVFVGAFFFNNDILRNDLCFFNRRPPPVARTP